jgi:hypothetical protein
VRRILFNPHALKGILFNPHALRWILFNPHAVKGTELSDRFSGIRH